MVVRKKGKAVKKAGKKAARKATKKKVVKAAKKGVKKPAAKGKKTAAKRSKAPGRPPRKPRLRRKVVKKVLKKRWRGGRPVVVVEGVPMETVSSVYLALSQIRGTLYGLIVSYDAKCKEGVCVDYNVSILETSGANSTDELNKVSGKRCDTLFGKESFTDEVGFMQALSLLREWLYNCMETLIPMAVEPVVVDESGSEPEPA